MRTCMCTFEHDGNMKKLAREPNSVLTHHIWTTYKRYIYQVYKTIIIIIIILTHSYHIYDLFEVITNY